MTSRRTIGIALTVLFASIGSGETPNAAWEKMKTLAGEWEGTTSYGPGVEVSYRLVSGGTALMETLHPVRESEMVTMYHPDGSRVLMTHYCSGGNQPRMRAENPSGEVRRLDFGFLDAANLSSPGDEHMRRLVVTFEDADHFTQEWTSVKNGKSETGKFRFTRKK